MPPALPAVLFFRQNLQLVFDCLVWPPPLIVSTSRDKLLVVAAVQELTCSLGQLCVAIWLVVAFSSTQLVLVPVFHSL